MSKRILILSFEKDYHALAIQALLRKQGDDADIVDLADFPTQLQLSHQGPSFTDIRLDGRPLSDYHSIWWRRVHVPRPGSDTKDPEEARFAVRESRDAIWGALLSSGLPIYNPPMVELLANYKPYQLKVARSCGLTIPDTLVTNSAEEVLALRSRHPQLIYKSFGPTDLMVMDTRPLRDEDLPELWRLKYAPAIFQQYVPRGREYRVTLVEDDVFATEVHIQQRVAEYDWRNDLGYQLTPVNLPEALADKLRQLRRALGLSSGSIDLREAPDGTVYFLEINPSGQFLFLDIRAGTDVGSRFCRMLVQ
jgi:hypothetical protein